MSSDVANAIVVLAAGRGTRMRSERPKVLQRLAGRPMLSHVLDTAEALEPTQLVVVYGYGGQAVMDELSGYNARWIEQPEQLGTGHAVACALPLISDQARVLVLCADVPLVSAQSLFPLLADPADTVSLLTVELTDPTGYGRIIRSNDDGAILGIVEEKDASAEQKAIQETNTGLLAAPAAALRDWLARLSTANAQGEYYLTDIVAMAAQQGYSLIGHRAPSPAEVAGVNDFVQLAHVEACWQERKRTHMMSMGLAMPAPERVIVRGQVDWGRDCAIDADVLLEGNVSLGNRVYIGAGAVLRDCRIGDGTRVEPYSVIEGAVIGANCKVGPFAHLRPQTQLDDAAKVGNFVEVKSASLGKGAKANHLSYLGDASVGARANIGAGTITCNYDGVRKHRTVIGEGAFIGSGTELVAPVQIGAKATIGAGTTVTRDTPEDALTVGRCRQKSIPGWRRPSLTNDEGAADDNSQDGAPSHLRSE